MGRKRVLGAFVAATFAASGLCASAPALAGQNSSAFAELSWDRDSTVTNRTWLPLGEFPLYVRLHNVHEARIIGLDLRWYPRTIDSLCYQMVDGPAADSCGPVVDLPPQSIPPDTGYTRRIEFQDPPSGDFCIIHWFSYADCAGIQPARFHVAALVLEDSEGGRDLVPVITEATILSGEGIEQPTVLQSSTSTWFVPGRTNHFHLRGIGLSEVEHVALEGEWGQLDADVTSGGDRTLHVSLDIPEEYFGEATLVAGDGVSMLATLPVQVTVADTTGETGDGVNGTAYPFDKPTDGGVWRKQASSSTWEFVPSVPDSIVNLGGGAASRYMIEHARPPRRTRATSPSRTRQAASLHRSSSASPGSSTPQSPGVDFWDVRTLFSETFEQDLSTGAGGTWRVSSVLDGRSWGRVGGAANCGVRFAGAWSGTPGGPRSSSPLEPAMCWGYQSMFTGLQQQTPTMLDSYLRADVGFWRSIDTRVGTITDSLEWLYSLDGGASWVKGRNRALSGAQLTWERELVGITNPTGDARSIKLRIDFHGAGDGIEVVPPNGQGVYIDDISIVGIPRPNLTFTTPLGWAGPVVASNSQNDFSNPPLLHDRLSYFSFAIRNNSVSASASFRVVLDIEGLGTVYDSQIPGMAPNEVRTIKNIPRSVPAALCGLRSATLYLDYQSGSGSGTVLEADEQDNQHSTNFHWSAPARPDLRVDYLLADPPSPCAGDVVTLRAVVSNAGSVASPVSNLGMATAPFGSAACSAGQIIGQVRALAPGERDTISTTVTSTTATTRAYYLKADCANQVAEGCSAEEDNNFFGPSNVTWVPLGADLAVTSLTVPSSTGTLGQSRQIRVVVANVGQAATPGTWSFDWYRDLASPPAAGQTGNSRITVKRALPPGQDTTLVFSRTSTTPGPWRMYARANVPESTPECRRFANNVAGPTLLTWTSDSLVVKGRFTYRDTGYVAAGAPVGSQGFAIHPLRGASVRIMDRNSGSTDRLLGTTCTDDNGEFALALASRHDPEAGPIDEPQHVVDVYARVLLVADPVCATIPAVKVVEAARDSTWIFESPTRMDVTSNLVDFGEIRPAADYGVRSAMHIYATLLNAAQRMRGFGFQPFLGMVPDTAWRVVVRWGEGAEGYGGGVVSASRRDTIYLVGLSREPRNAFAPDEWDDHQILHEYGHHLARLGGFNYLSPPGTPDSCSTHGWESALECPPGSFLHGLAWEEGWCHFVAALLDSTPASSILRDSGIDAAGGISRFTFDLETGIGRFLDQSGAPFDTFGVNHSGPAFEGANAAALWDWVDAIDDDQNSDGCGDHLAEPFERFIPVFEDLALGETRIDSLVNLYMAYQSKHLTGDLAASRALFDVLCEHGFWRRGDDRDTVGYVDVGDRVPRPVVFSVLPTLSSGPVRFSLSGSQDSPADAPRFVLYDLAGRVLWRGRPEAGADGTWWADWNGRTLSGADAQPGIYFARCATRDRAFSRTLVVRR